MLIEKLSQSEKALLEILEHPLWNAEFMRSMMDEEWEHTEYQNNVLTSTHNYISFRAGRAVGKSEALLDKVVYFLMNDFFVTHTLAVVTPNRVHLEPLWRKITRWLAFHPLLKFYKQSVNSQVFTITTTNGMTMDCRIAGISGTGASVVGLHTPVLFIDEAAFLDWPVWIELVPTVNTWEKGFQVFVCGTPSGERENNVLYFTDQVSAQYQQFRVSAHDNPRYSPSDEERNLQQYGGADSDDYQRLVLGEHASPVSMLFAKGSLPLQNIPVHVARLTQQELALDPLKLNRLIDSFPLLDKTAVGIDLGFTDPTIISFFHQQGKSWVNYGRIRLVHIEYPTQIKIINRLDDRYKFLFVAIDEGHAGVAVTQELIANYPHKNYIERLVSVNFAASHIVGVDLDDKEIKLRVRSLAVEKLRRLFNNGKLFLPTKDQELLSELERVEAYRGRMGKTLYRVRTSRGGHGADHIFASLLCFAYAIFIKDDLIEPTMERVKLFVSKWG